MGHCSYLTSVGRNLNHLTRDETSPELTTSDLGASDFRNEGATKWYPNSCFQQNKMRNSTFWSLSMRNSQFRITLKWETPRFGPSQWETPEWVNLWQRNCSKLLSLCGIGSNLWSFFFSEYFQLKKTTKIVVYSSERQQLPFFNLVYFYIFFNILIFIFCMLWINNW